MGRETYANTAPTFVADPSSVMQNTGRQIDWASVGDDFRSDSFYVQLAAAALAAATSLTVDALEGPLKAGQLLYFGQAGELARLSADAATGATTLAVDAIPAALEDNDRALVRGTVGKSIAAGTAMAELASGEAIPRASVTGAETASFILATAASETSKTDALTGYGGYVGGTIYQNLLPDFSNSAWATWRGELATAGHFVWETYEDSLSE